MTASEPITLDWTTQQQKRAANPQASAWVSANAGSGKTHVLAQRVVRLLLNGARPSSILCLTYTKAAASEMANRVFERLAEWTRLDDGALETQLIALDGQPPAPSRLVRARQLFALALETPGGLKIKTIHAFCESILHQFPLEANVAGHFSAMEDGEADAMMGQARRMLLTSVTMEDEAELAEAFATVLDLVGEAGLDGLLNDIVSKRTSLTRFVDEASRHGGIRAVLERAAGLGAGESEETIVASVWPLPTMPPDMIDAYKHAAAGVSQKTPRKYAEALAKAQNAATAGERWTALAGLCLKTNGEPRASLKDAGAGKIDSRIPDIQDRMTDVLGHFLDCLDRLKRRRMVTATRAALTLARRFQNDYERLKRQQGRLDFEDLIELTVDLLQRRGAQAWVHYKLDQGIDHILVDEAQDTSPRQWAIVRRLSDEFFSDPHRPRTLFAVGDQKQSIYSFQGARPERFDSERRDVKRIAGESDAAFESVELKLSFRSTDEVLRAVDAVFDPQVHRRGLASGDDAIVHASARGKDRGSVEVWDMIDPDPKADEEADWTAPYDDTPESDRRAKLARRIGAALRAWIGRETLDVKGEMRPVGPGDILVLVRKRDAFVEALMRELKNDPPVAVAGADRLTLTDHIAVKDLMALGRVACLADDDLSLAALMKSPLFDLSEDDIFVLCHERAEADGVRDHLAELAAAGRAPFAAAERRLSEWLEMARSMSVHDFYATVLGPDGGRAAFLARLGSEAGDVMDAFLGFALDHETSGLPGLHSFLSVLEEQAPVIKRELDQGRDEVRVMTVHAAKGLEAPIVYLVDSGGAPVLAQHIDKIRSVPVSGMENDALFWVANRSLENTVSETLKRALSDAAEEEYRRLLYVGMTRAADHLVVCGYQSERPPDALRWHDMVSASLADLAEPRTFTVGDLEWQGLAFRRDSGDEDERLAPPTTAAANAAVPGTPADKPAAIGPLPPPSMPPRPLQPSGTGAFIDGEDTGPQKASPFGEATSRGGAGGLERGRIVHRLLQVLPETAPVERESAGRRYLARTAYNRNGGSTEELLERVLTIVDDPNFQDVFAAGSEAEVSIMGTVELGSRSFAVSGRVDRLAVANSRVLIIDYKTNRPACRDRRDVPETYLAQMAIYRALLAPLYPGKRIEAGLLFTEGPHLIGLTDADLDQALARLTAK